jgi:glycosyltransferase involved in cell wall biosynthesis
MKIALVHDYLYTYGGGERMLELFHNLYPEADIYTILYDKHSLPDSFRTWNIHTTFLDRVPLKKVLFPYLVPLMPQAIESIDTTGYDLVLSISAGFAKGVLTNVETCHISYILTVPRFLWGYETSREQFHKKNILLPFINKKLRMWDRLAADRVDYMIANSQTTQKRIAKAYAAFSDVIPSPVDEEKFSLSTIQRESYYLVVSRLEEYKRVDLAIEACNKDNLKLVIIGEGTQKKKLQSMAGANVEFLGYVDDATMLRYYKSAKAVIFPGADDLGLVPIEAQMCGTPVVAYGKDGSLETIASGVSGVFFSEQTVESLLDALAKLSQAHLQPQTIRESVMRFSTAKVQDELRGYIETHLAEYQRKYRN